MIGKAAASHLRRDDQHDFLSRLSSTEPSLRSDALAGHDRLRRLVKVLRTSASSMPLGGPT
jgi:hypothetical protein